MAWRLGQDQVNYTLALLKVHLIFRFEYNAKVLVNLPGGLRIHAMRRAAAEAGRRANEGQGG